MKHKLFFTGIVLLLHLHSFAQPKGNLFIIGGGDRTPQLIQKLISTAQLSAKDYIVVLPMATEEPDTAYYYIKTELEQACSNTIANLNFTKNIVKNLKFKPYKYKGNYLPYHLRWIFNNSVKTNEIVLIQEIEALEVH